MIQAFMSQVASEIGQASNGSDAVDASKKLVAYAALLEPLKWVPGAEPWASLTAQVMRTTGMGVGAVGKLQKLNISKRRESLKTALRRLNRKIVIVMDDIDRLPPVEVFQAIRAIQAVVDLPFCSFVIALDPGYVENALCAAASFDLPGQYLDKIIQLRLPLPRINRAELEAFFEDRLLSSLSPLQHQRLQADQSRFQHIWHLGLKPLLRTPRDAIRIINRFLYVEPSCGDEVSWGDLIGLHALAILYPSVYNHILGNPGAYTGVDMDDRYQRSHGQELVDQCAAERAKFLKDLDSKSQSALLRLLEELFPLIRSYPYDKRDQRGFSLQRRVASSQRLKVALSYDLPSDELAQQEIILFLTSPHERRGILDSVCEKNLLERLLERVLQEHSQTPIPDPSELVIFLGNIIEKQQLGNPLTGISSIFLMPPLKAIVLAADEILSSSCIDDETALHNVVSNPSVLSLSAHLIARKYLSEQRGASEADSDSKPTLATIENSKTLAIWLDTTTAAFNDSSFLGVSDKLQVVHSLLAIKEGRARLPELLATYFESGESIDQVSDVFIRRSSITDEDSTIDFVSCEKDYLSMLGDASSIRALAKQRLEELGDSASPKLKAIYSAVAFGGRFNLTDGSAAKDNFQ
jgi:hypothetical protein